MAPPTAPLHLDVEAISGICGSISLVAWVIVFSPQIIENFRRSSADGLSVQFIIAWLLGDVFNVLGALFQGVLPTMLILAIYYTIADVVLLGQCFYYKGFTWRDDAAPPPKPSNNGHANGGTPTERSALLTDHFAERERRGSGWSHLSPAVPMMPEQLATPLPTPTRWQSFLWNSVAILMVCAAGVAGWFLSRGYTSGKPAIPADDYPVLDLWGQIFGWLCAVLYLGSRLPQLLLNFRRKSTEGISVLFFLFACLGNLTYVLSIFAYEPVCRKAECEPAEARQIYAKYLLVNASWLAGSLGTLLLDLSIFAQFFIYDQDESERNRNEAVDDGENENDSLWDHRPLLERAGSGPC
ncbi:PQ loop repeat-domain-containing protein [Xylaria bambusicola]|uniref:PQ loop repeat-domain-containing protein n=1 Tax=Xylaria bambusicola TaxID=326684 RepID=UPI0020072BEA|nr:PQ loop repeat-domain-containing protein [Xylaria bambusicola]KAI0526291.1 PQ loop repeat-domain-containing protein [Xylaria bambusicola]